MKTQKKKTLGCHDFPGALLPPPPPGRAESAEGIRAASALRHQSCEGSIMMCETPSCQLPAAGPALPLE